MNDDSPRRHQRFDAIVSGALQRRLGGPRTASPQSFFHTIVFAFMLWSAISMSASATKDNYGDELPEGALIRFGTVRLRHGDTVSSVAYFPDGNRFASASWDATISVWDSATGREMLRLGNPDELLRVYSVDVSPDGTLIASGGLDRKVRVWRVSDGHQLHMLKGHTDFVLAVAFSPDGKLLASCSGSADETIRLWSVASGKCRAVLRGHSGAVNAIRFSPDGSLLASASMDKTVRIWDVKQRKETRKLSKHGDRVMAIAFSHDGRLLASGTGDSDVVIEESVVRLWNVTTGRMVRSIASGNGGVAAIGYSPDNSTLAVAASKRMLLIEARTGQERAHRDIGTWTTSVSFNPRGSRLVVGSHECAIGLFEADKLQPAIKLDAPTDAPWNLAVSSDGKLLATADGQRCSRVWEIATGKMAAARRWKTNLVPNVGFIDAKSTLAVVTASRNDNYVELWDFANDKTVGRLGPYPGRIEIATTADGRTLVLGAADHGKLGQSVELWDIASLRRRDVLHIESGGHMALGEFGTKCLLAIFGDGRLHVWDLDKRRFIIDTDCDYSVDDCCTFAAGGSLVIGSESIHGNVECWDLRAPTRARRLATLEQPVIRVCCSADGRIVAAGCIDGNIRLLRLSDGAVIATFRAHRDSVNGLAFMPGSNNLLLSAGADTTALLWDINTLLKK